MQIIVNNCWYTAGILYDFVPVTFLPIMKNKVALEFSQYLTAPLQTLTYSKVQSCKSKSKYVAL